MHRKPYASDLRIICAHLLPVDLLPVWFCYRRPEGEEYQAAKASTDAVGV